MKKSHICQFYFQKVIPPLTSFRIAQTAEFCITESRNDEIGFRLGSTVPSATPFSNFPAKEARVYPQLTPVQQTKVQNLCPEKCICSITIHR